MADDLEAIMRAGGCVHLQGHDPSKPPMDVREVENYLGNKEVVARSPIDLDRLTVRPAPRPCINSVIIEIDGHAAQVGFSELIRSINAAVGVTRGSLVMADPVVNCVPPHPSAHLTDAEIMDRLKALTPPPDAVALVDALEEAYADVLDIPDKIAGVDSIAAVNARHVEARAAVLAAMRPTPAGWKLVPVEPTEVMIDDGVKAGEWDEEYNPAYKQTDFAKDVYQVMIAAAPETPR